MTVLVEPLGAVPEVIPGFVNRLRFRFSPYHDRRDIPTYELLGPYDIDVCVEWAGMGNAFIGSGHLRLLGPDLSQDHLNNVVGSRSAGQIAVWQVDIELSRETVAAIDAARRPLGDAPVRFAFDWHVWVRERIDETGGPKCGGSRIERVNQSTGQGSSGPVIVSVPASGWFKVTEAYGFPSRRFIELVFPTVDKARWLAAVNDLAQADRDFDSRRDTQTMDFCERAFEDVLGKQVVMGVSDEAKCKGEIAKLLGHLVNQRKREMLVNLIYDAVVFARRGKHGVVPAGHPEFDPDSGDAELGLLIAKALLGFISKQ